MEKVTNYNLIWMYDRNAGVVHNQRIPCCYVVVFEGDFSRYWDFNQKHNFGNNCCVDIRAPNIQSYSTCLGQLAEALLWTQC